MKRATRATSERRDVGVLDDGRQQVAQEHQGAAAVAVVALVAHLDHLSDERLDVDRSVDAQGGREGGAEHVAHPAQSVDDVRTVGAVPQYLAQAFVQGAPARRGRGVRRAGPTSTSRVRPRRPSARRRPGRGMGSGRSRCRRRAGRRPAGVRRPRGWWQPLQQHAPRSGRRAAARWPASQSSAGRRGRTGRGSARPPRPPARRRQGTLPRRACGQRGRVGRDPAGVGEDAGQVVLGARGRRPPVHPAGAGPPGRPARRPGWPHRPTVTTRVPGINRSGHRDDHDARARVAVRVGQRTSRRRQPGPRAWRADPAGRPACRPGSTITVRPGGRRGRTGSPARVRPPGRGGRRGPARRRAAAPQVGVGRLVGQHGQPWPEVDHRMGPAHGVLVGAEVEHDVAAGPELTTPLWTERKFDGPARASAAGDDHRLDAERAPAEQPAKPAATLARPATTGSRPARTAPRTPSRATGPRSPRSGRRAGPERREEHRRAPAPRRGPRSRRRRGGPAAC